MRRKENPYYQSKIFRKEAIRIAKDLQYPQSVLDKIERASNEEEVSRILAQARHDSHEKEMKQDGIKRTHRGNRC